VSSHAEDPPGGERDDRARPLPAHRREPARAGLERPLARGDHHARLALLEEVARGERGGRLGQRLVAVLGGEHEPLGVGAGGARRREAAEARAEARDQPPVGPGDRARRLGERAFEHEAPPGSVGRGRRLVDPHRSARHDQELVALLPQHVARRRENRWPHPLERRSLDERAPRPGAEDLRGLEQPEHDAVPLRGQDRHAVLPDRCGPEVARGERERALERARAIRETEEPRPVLRAERRLVDREAEAVGLALQRHEVAEPEAPVLGTGEGGGREEKEGKGAHGAPS
jgi:hypothetical protein